MVLLGKEQNKINLEDNVPTKTNNYNNNIQGIIRKENPTKEGLSDKIIGVMQKWIDNTDLDDKSLSNSIKVFGKVVIIGMFIAASIVPLIIIGIVSNASNPEEIDNK
ncbi:MAG: hypothetical protein ACP5RQ_02715 [Candidatus Micrarchaeia archaeon]